MPDIAGEAKLKYKEVKAPSRDGKVITLPETCFDVYLLPEADQFLCIEQEDEKTKHFKTDKRRGIWFGGTDEQPFLVELESEDMNNKSKWIEIWKNNLVHEELKPEIIKLYEERFGKEKTLRQGDIFAYPLPTQDWEEIDLWEETLGRRHRMKCDDCGLDIYETRHRFTHGEIATWGTHIVCKGTLKAPDHKDLILPKICVLAQTNHLKNPKKAD